MIHIYFEYFFVVILIAFIYSLFELEISVIFNVKMIIGENVGFYLVLVFIQEESDLDFGFEFEICNECKC